MIPDAARMRRWMLQGMPAIGLIALGMHAGGGAAGMLAWMLLGIGRLPCGHYPYPRKRGGRPGRLFFSYAAGAFLISLPAMLIQLLYPDFFARTLFYPILLQLGSTCLSTAFSSRLMISSVPERAGWYLGLHLLLFCLLFIFYKQ